MAIDNDTRGWILTTISALACLLGASVVCIDLLIRRLPGKQGFKIQDSNGFLSCSLSLSAGVMLFSALYNMLPSSKTWLEKGGYSSKGAAWILIACFLAGVWGIQILSRLMHRFMPSHVVDCDHTHDDDGNNDHGHDHEQDQKKRGSSVATQKQQHQHQNGQGHIRSVRPRNGRDPELEPLLPRPGGSDTQQPVRPTSGPEMAVRESQDPLELGAWNKPSFHTRMTMRVSEFVSGTKAYCDHDGPCRGYSHPCGVECFKNINARGGLRGSNILTPRPTLHHSASTGFRDRQNTVTALDEEALLAQSPQESPSATPVHVHPDESRKWSRTPTAYDSEISSATPLASQPSELKNSEQVPHHHHVPENAYLSLSLQTSVAIALHKLPEGFITYATNHVNAKLGFSVFLALAIHNVSEGFALALPIFLATKSRVKCLLYSLVLGGLSQPLGAGVAAVWLNIAERGRGDYSPGEAAYGGMFAATAGIMASVGLNLLQQSFELSHNKGLCMFFAFVGMGILGMSSALTA